MKICLNHIASVQRGQYASSYSDGVDQQVVQRIVESNPLLEAFGNAKTRRNDNSSRFGKYLQLQFNRGYESGPMSSPCQLVGSKCQTYLLEKTRVCHHDHDERTFHIFYQLLGAPDEEKSLFWDGLRGTTPNSFNYVGATTVGAIEGVQDSVGFQQTLKSLELVGVVGDKLSTLMRAICITMQLGNLQFGCPDGDIDKSTVATGSELRKLSSLMGVSEEDLSSALTERTFQTAKESHKVPLNEDSAREARDALAKEIYQRTFSWLVGVLNESTCSTAGHGIVGLLDIFGFESFSVNRFEQLCINYANEKLQQKFNQDVFENVKLEYNSEGIDLGDIFYEDNTAVLDLIEGRHGLLNLLNEECIRPKGNDVDYVRKSLRLNNATTQGSLPLVPHRTDRLSFAIKHYAGKVMYDAEGFVSKNLDTLHYDLQRCVAKSSNAIVSFTLSPQKGGHNDVQRSNVNAPTVWTKYKAQLSDLMEHLKTTKSRYIRCIKPNGLKEAGLMDHKQTVDQLRCAGVVAGITISRSCFPNRLGNSIVLARYSDLADHNTLPAKKSDSMTLEERTAEDCKALLSSALLSKREISETGMVTNAYVVGKTKTFFRAGALEYLESKRDKGVESHAVVIQRAARGWLARNAGNFHKKQREMEAARSFEERKRMEAERRTRTERERAEQRAAKQAQLKMNEGKCNALELEVLSAELNKMESCKALAQKQEESKREISRMEDRINTLAEKNYEEVRAEKMKQQSDIERNNSMIAYLKRENKALRKDFEKTRSKLCNQSTINEQLANRSKTVCGNIDVAEELTIKEKSKLDVLTEEYEAAKSFNRDAKAKLRKQQKEYMDLAMHRLDLQKTLKQILLIIEQHRGKPNRVVSEVNLIVHTAESCSKAEMAQVEAEFPAEATDYTDTTSASSVDPVC